MTFAPPDPTSTPRPPAPRPPAPRPPAPRPLQHDAAGTDRRGTLARRFGLDLAYVLVGLPVAIASFVAVVTLLSVSVGLLVVWVGFPLLVLTLLVARGFAGLERGRLRLRGDRLPPVVYRRRPPRSGVFSFVFGRLRDRQAWLDVVHGIVGFPIALATWVVTVAWSVATVSGLTYWFWERFIPDDDEQEGLVDLLDWDVSEALLQFAIGVVGLLTIVPVVRLLASAQAGLAKAMLSNEHVAELQSRVEQLTVSRAAAVEAEVSSLRRLERDIHDGPQQRLVRLGMDLASVERRMDDDPTAARALVAEARLHTAAALEELRALSRGIAPPILADRGLGPALADLAARSSIPVELDDDTTPGGPVRDRLPAPVETAVYFSVAEALTNVAKHSRATCATVRIWRTGSGDTSRVVVEVIDDGVGGAATAKGHGLAGLRDRLAALDGTLEIVSPPGGPTRVIVEVPCAS